MATTKTYTDNSGKKYTITIKGSPNVGSSSKAGMAASRAGKAYSGSSGGVNYSVSAPYVKPVTNTAPSASGAVNVAGNQRAAQSASRSGAAYKGTTPGGQPYSVSRPYVKPTNAYETTAGKPQNLFAYPVYRDVGTGALTKESVSSTGQKNLPVTVAYTPTVTLGTNQQGERVKTYTTSINYKDWNVPTQKTTVMSIPPQGEIYTPEGGMSTARIPVTTTTTTIKEPGIFTKGKTNKTYYNPSPIQAFILTKGEGKAPPYGQQYSSITIEQETPSKTGTYLTTQKTNWGERWNAVNTNVYEKLPILKPVGRSLYVWGVSAENVGETIIAKTREPNITFSSVEYTPEGYVSSVNNPTNNFLNKYTRFHGTFAGKTLEYTGQAAQGIALNPASTVRDYYAAKYFGEGVGMTSGYLKSLSIMPTSKTLRGIGTGGQIVFTTAGVAGGLLWGTERYQTITTSERPGYEIFRTGLETTGFFSGMQKGITLTSPIITGAEITSVKGINRVPTEETQGLITKETMKGTAHLSAFGFNDRQFPLTAEATTKYDIIQGFGNNARRMESTTTTTYNVGNMKMTPIVSRTFEESDYNYIQNLQRGSFKSYQPTTITTGTYLRSKGEVSYGGVTTREGEPLYYYSTFNKKTSYQLAYKTPEFTYSPSATIGQYETRFNPRDLWKIDTGAIASPSSPAPIKMILPSSMTMNTLAILPTAIKPALSIGGIGTITTGKIRTKIQTTSRTMIGTTNLSTPTDIATPVTFSTSIGMSTPVSVSNILTGTGSRMSYNYFTNSPRIISPEVPIIVTPIIPVVPGIPSFIFPKGGGGRSSFKSEKRGRGTKTQYTASIWAEVMGIKGKSYGSEFTGIGIRPLR